MALGARLPTATTPAAGLSRIGSLSATPPVSGTAMLAAISRDAMQRTPAAAGKSANLTAATAETFAAARFARAFARLVRPAAAATA